MKFKILFSLLCYHYFLPAQSVIGTWKTVDDRDGAEKSYVEIYEKQGKVDGRIIKLLKEAPDKVCDKCTGKRKDQPLMGMQVIEALVQDKTTYTKGKILDPVTGNEYACSIWLEPGKPNELRVRGKHWSGIYRTQTWFRVL